MGREQQSKPLEKTVFGMTKEQIQVLYDEVKRDNEREDLILLGPSTPNADFQKAFRKGSRMLCENPATRAVFSKIQEE